MPPKKPYPYIYWIIIFLLLLYLIPVSVLAFKNFLFSSASSTITPAKDELFDVQNAMILGKITAISGNNIQVENNRGIKGTLELSKNLVISDLLNPLATPSGDLKKIQINKSAQIILASNDGKYQVVTINFQPLSYIPQQIPQNPDQTTPATNNTLAPVTIPPLPTTPSFPPDLKQSASASSTPEKR